MKVHDLELNYKEILDFHPLPNLKILHFFFIIKINKNEIRFKLYYQRTYRWLRMGDDDGVPIVDIVRNPLTF